MAIFLIEGTLVLRPSFESKTREFREIHQQTQKHAVASHTHAELSFPKDNEATKQTVGTLLPKDLVRLKEFQQFA